MKIHDCDLKASLEHVLKNYSNQDENTPLAFSIETGMFVGIVSAFNISNAKIKPKLRLSVIKVFYFPAFLFKRFRFRNFPSLLPKDGLRD